MRARSLKTTILWSFLAIIVLLVCVIGATRYYSITKYVISAAEGRLRNDLDVARSVYMSEIELMRAVFGFIENTRDLATAKEKSRLDYLYFVEAADKGKVQSEIVKKAFSGSGQGGTRIIAREELIGMDPDLYEKAHMGILFTLKAKPTYRKELTSAMAIEYARPFFDPSGKVSGVLYGGKILNRDFALVDKIKEMVFGDQMYDKKPLGTVTIFQDDVRISTNVLNDKGERAIGTRVSQAVYDKVVLGGEVWVDRAFVVTDWYLTGYEPIKNIEGRIIGVLYVGILEKPYNDMKVRILAVFLLFMACSIALAVAVSFLLAGLIARPVEEMLGATKLFSEGRLDHRMKPHTRVKELRALSDSFNEMAAKLEENYWALKNSNGKLLELNKSYLDLVGFVSHELKGILSSTILNAYSLRDGFLGMVNFKQQKALDSITRNLDYLESTVKNFLSLSRIEKGEMPVNKKDVRIKEDVFDEALESFAKQISEKNIAVTNGMKSGVTVRADRDLMIVVANNLIGNAVKYGSKGGKIELASLETPTGDLEVSVYNDGRVITENEKGSLFKKFSRLDGPETKGVKGTGLGLFLTREIIVNHGGEISVVPGDEGNTFRFSIKKGG